ncbi:MAG: hypothetical protein GY820_30775, partial [Gammaproteobacteria bacterium]|nr:hypothetical protein [Gammaproteobacteria bacterium]
MVGLGWQTICKPSEGNCRELICKASHCRWSGLGWQTIGRELQGIDRQSVALPMVGVRLANHLQTMAENGLFCRYFADLKP